MPRRSAGFVAKRPHRKSRGGCYTCKRKKVKCDEVQPTCAFCALRRLECTYPPDPHKRQCTSDAEITIDDLIEYNQPLNVSLRLIPSVTTAAGQLSDTELKYMHHYQTTLWSHMSLVKSDEITHITRDWVPQTSISTDYMLYSLISISAHDFHRRWSGSTQKESALSLTYRQKALASYQESLNNITSENYESLLMTSTWMPLLVLPPTLPCSDDVCIAWASSYLNMMQGMKFMAALRWMTGIEKLTVYPLLRRELKELPPPPMLASPGEWLFSVPGEDNDWQHPNPPGDNSTRASSPATGSTATSLSGFTDNLNLPFRSQKPPSTTASPHGAAFLPPPLMVLLHRLVCPIESGPLDLNRSTLVPILHALSPIFLSLYHYRLSSDLHVRIFVFPTFMTPGFLALFTAQEPRACLIVAWYFALLEFIPDGNRWFPKEVVARLRESLRNVVVQMGDDVLVKGMELAQRIARDVEYGGREAGAKAVFEGWEGVELEDRQEERGRVEECW